MLTITSPQVLLHGSGAETELALSQPAASGGQVANVIAIPIGALPWSYAALQRREARHPVDAHMSVPMEPISLRGWCNHVLGGYASSTAFLIASKVNDIAQDAPTPRMASGEVFSASVLTAISFLLSAF